MFIQKKLTTNKKVKIILNYIKIYFINIKCIKHIEIKNRVIYFDNGYSTNIVSSKYLKVIINYLNHQHIEH